MGKLLILARYVFLIYGSDILEGRRHVHITYNQRGHKRSCKFWLEPDVRLDESKKGDFTEKELYEIEKLVIENLHILNKQLDIFYKQERVTAIRK